MKTNPHPSTCVDAEIFAADVELEGPPEVEFNPGIASRIPAKGSAGGALVRNTSGQVLFVVPMYKPFLDIPGGIADANESPKAACQREVVEEIGPDIAVGRLLVVDWIPRNGVWRDSHQFVFDGGVLTDEQASAARTHDDELTGVRFLSLDEAAPRIHPSLHRRLELAVNAAESGTTIYAEFGHAL
ncbi:NUDIX domain-containing protein [Lentzea jiangxiensis]|uniref:ADP-ribose pyrophosphatase YjhB, NUDIX family n=1 Tax=Lentzea jiangxiensis TaxID=641025 RepID=A0A1H0DIQ0_9PSEU|nr:NUDIX hydrolase [Lentzea jiangxiensis]SDN70035.1 ADP-ribose pyrophosphatase YjhB, NUDIX family [Lentzea jiangxiensis]